MNVPGILYSTTTRVNINRDRLVTSSLDEAKNEERARWTQTWCKRSPTTPILCGRRGPVTSCLIHRRRGAVCYLEVGYVQSEETQGVEA